MDTGNCAENINKTEINPLLKSIFMNKNYFHKNFSMIVIF